MKKISLLLTLLAAAGCTQEKNTRDNTQFVNVFTGTDVHGHTFPGAARPFAMVQLGPDTHLMGWDASSGYHYGDSVIYAFSHTHLSGTGIGDLGDVALLPYTGGDTLQKPVGTFSHERESARPGYYRVRLDNYGVDVELTSTDRAGIHRYTFDGGERPRVMLDLAHILQPNWGHKLVSNDLEIISDSVVRGTFRTQGWAHFHAVSYTIHFSQAAQITVRENGNTVALPAGEPFTSTETVRVYFAFPEASREILVKVAVSPVDTEGAERNMAAELPGWDFDAVRGESARIWRDVLSSVEVGSSDTTVMWNFYTALYHTMIAPLLWQDADGNYKGMDKRIRTAPEGYTNYTALSLWDTFRAWFPLMTIIAPERAAMFGETLMQGYREGTILPKWPLASNYTGCMVAYPAIPVLADLQSKGLLRSDPAAAAEAALRSSVYRADLAEKFAGTRELDLITRHPLLRERYGFVPADSIAESVSWGLEMAYGDWCAARLCLAAGDTASYRTYMDKSELWKRYFDPETGMMRGVMGDGSFRTPFNPFYSSHMSSDYTEGTAFQWSFFVPHDMPGFIAAHGGRERLEAALDTLFTSAPRVDGPAASGDITGLIGQYAHGNEPSHHIAYLYNWTGSPHKGQHMLDSIMRTFYMPAPDGIIGNEDMGQMSAWYVMSALGFYQVCPGDPVYSIGRPMVDGAKIRVPGGIFRVVVHNNAAANRYVENVRLNGRALDGLSFTHTDIKPGGKLEITMTDKPAALR